MVSRPTLMYQEGEIRDCRPGIVRHCVFGILRLRHTLMYVDGKIDQVISSSVPESGGFLHFRGNPRFAARDC